MTEMVERAVKAFWSAYADEFNGWDALDADERKRLDIAMSAAIQAIKEGGAMLVPVTVAPVTKPIRPADLRAGHTYRMKRGGIRRIDRIEKMDVFWTRMDAGRYQGRSGCQWGPYFAKDAAEVIEAALADTKAEG